MGLLGPNGAGKTTSFYMIVGLVPADSGRIEIDGSNITSMPIHKRARMGLSYLPQDASVFRRLTVEQNIRAVLELQLGPNGKAAARGQDPRQPRSPLEELQIGHIRANTAISLSGGERRQVEIARALATSPRFILLDEPFAGVDPIAVIEIQRIVRFLKGRGIGVLITDHNVRGNPGHLRPRLHHQRRQGPHRWAPRRDRRRPGRAPRLSGRAFPHVSGGCAASSRESPKPCARPSGAAIKRTQSCASATCIGQ